MSNDKVFKIKHGLEAPRFAQTVDASTPSEKVPDYNYGTVSSVKEFSLSSYESVPTSIRFNSDGTKMFIIGRGHDEINEFSLSTAYDIETATHNGAFSLGSGNWWDFAFNSDGTRLITLSNNSGEYLKQYNLSTGFDVSTATDSGNSFDLSTAVSDASLRAMTGKPDLSRLLTFSYVTKKVYEINLSTAGDLSTASYDDVTLTLSDLSATEYALAVTPDGTALYAFRYGNGPTDRYDLSTAWDISTAGSSVQVGSRYPFVSSGGTTCLTFAFLPLSSDLRRLWLAAYNPGGDPAIEFSTVGSETDLDVSTCSYRKIEMSSVLTVTFSNPPASGKAASFVVEVSGNTGGSGITWPSSVSWEGGSTPTVGENSVFSFLTIDSGSSYLGKKVR